MKIWVLKDYGAEIFTNHNKLGIRHIDSGAIILEPKYQEISNEVTPDHKVFVSYVEHNLLLNEYVQLKLNWSEKK